MSRQSKMRNKRSAGKNAANQSTAKRGHHLPYDTAIRWLHFGIQRRGAEVISGPQKRYFS